MLLGGVSQVVLAVEGLFLCCLFLGGEQGGGGVHVMVVEMLYLRSYL